MLGCPCGLTGSKAHPKPEHQCKLVGAVSYTLGSAAKSTSRTPCTNRPLKCTVCAATIWSYSMALHFERKHVGMQMCVQCLELVCVHAESLSLLAECFVCA